MRLPSADPSLVLSPHYTERLAGRETHLTDTQHGGVKPPCLWALSLAEHWRKEGKDKACCPQEDLGLRRSFGGGGQVRPEHKFCGCRGFSRAVDQGQAWCLVACVPNP